jgi:hypothetical protein
MRSRPAAGSSAEAYYRLALAQWQAQPWLRCTRIGCVAGLAVCLGVEAFWVRETAGWSLGLAAGLFCCLYMLASEMAPEHIERWHTGAQAERRTERVLWPLERAGWRALHDLPAAYGNLDHVLIGPAGVFLLDTKQYGGSVTVVGDQLQIKRRANPRADYQVAHVARRLRGASAQLHRELAGLGERKVWVQAAVVVWSRFEQGQAEGDRVMFIHGSQLTEWLAGLPVRLDAAQIEALHAALLKRPAGSQAA